MKQNTSIITTTM